MKESTANQNIANKRWLADLLTAINAADERPPFYRCPSCGNDGFLDELHDGGRPLKKECLYYELGIEDGRAGGSDQAAVA